MYHSDRTLCMHVYVSVCMHACVCVCVYACMCMCICLYVWIHARVCMSVYVCTCACVYECTCVHAQKRTCVRAYGTFSCPMMRRARERCTAKADARTLPLFVPILSLGVCGSWEDSSVSSRC